MDQPPRIDQRGEPYGSRRAQDRRPQVAVFRRVRATPVDELDPPALEAWKELEHRALEPNAYLSPHFLLPAIRHHGGGQASSVLQIERMEGATPTLVGLGVFRLTASSTRFPLPHLSAFHSPHSYLSGLLVDRRDAQQSVAAFLDYVCRSGQPWHGVEFICRPADGPLAGLLDAGMRARGLRWCAYSNHRRAALAPAAGGDHYVDAQLSSSRRKDLRRRRRRLEALGEVYWRTLRGAEVDDTCIERFLALEHLGWKREHGTSLRSSHHDTAFFREMVRNFARDDRAVFSELWVGERIIASTSNFISGRAGFAFKLGWDPDYAAMSPGLLNEIELVRRAPAVFAGLDHLDSGAGEESFMNELWSDRRRITSGAIATTASGRAALTAMAVARRLKKRLSAVLPTRASSAGARQEEE